MATISDDMKPPALINSMSSDGEAGVPESQEIRHDAVFGEVTEKGPNYRNVKFPNPFPKRPGTDALRS